MPESHDVPRLFKQIGSNEADFREITREEEAAKGIKRWPLFGNPFQTSSPPPLTDAERIARLGAVVSSPPSTQPVKALGLRALLALRQEEAGIRAPAISKGIHKDLLQAEQPGITSQKNEAESEQATSLAKEPLPPAFEEESGRKPLFRKPSHKESPTTTPLSRLFSRLALIDRDGEQQA